jgi:hypothetical protein
MIRRAVSENRSNIVEPMRWALTDHRAARTRHLGTGRSRWSLRAYWATSIPHTAPLRADARIHTSSNSREPWLATNTPKTAPRAVLSGCRKPGDRPCARKVTRVLNPIPATSAAGSPTEMPMATMKIRKCRM